MRNSSAIIANIVLFLLPMMVSSNRISIVMAQCLGMTLFVLHLIYVYHFSSPYPINDDYDMFLGSLINFEEANGLWNKLIVLFAQHMEHRPAFPRIVALIVWKITGNCDFRLLILIGNLMLFLTWWMISNSIKKLTSFQTILINIFVVVTLVGTQSMENIFWATSSLQNYSLIAFSLCAVHFSLKNQFIISAVFAILAICSSMAGFLLFL